MQANVVVRMRESNFATLFESSVDVPVTTECEGECSLSQPKQYETNRKRTGIGITAQDMQGNKHTAADDVKASQVKKAKR